MGEIVTVVHSEITVKDLASVEHALMRGDQIAVLISGEMQTFKVANCVSGFGGLTVTNTFFNEAVIKEIEPDSRIQALLSQLSRAKMQRNKNLMRDLEQRIKCIRGY